MLFPGRNMRGYPSVVSLQFVGCPSKNKNMNVDNLNEIIYKKACGMDSIRGQDRSLGREKNKTQ